MATKLTRAQEAELYVKNPDTRAEVTAAREKREKEAKEKADKAKAPAPAKPAPAN